jgi:FKBP-type peptidyl-prolyl cis-trans isomerase
LIGSAAAIKQRTEVEPDVYGPNGDNYTNVDANYDTSRIGIDIKEKGTGPKCKEGDWTTVHWTGYLKDGREITNSWEENDGRPKVFNLGAREVFYCWDLAIPKLHQGDKVHLDCPSYYVYGGAFTWAPVGGEAIPLHSDVDFELEVVECSHMPEFIEQIEQPLTTSM